MIDVLLVDDEALVRSGLCDWLETVEGIRVVADLSSAEECLDRFEELNPDVFLIDIMMPGVSGIELVKQIRARRPEAHCLILSGSHTPDLVLDGFAAGACGYLPKRTSPEELGLALREVHAGKSYISPTVTDSLVELALDMRQKLADVLPDQSVRALTDRERELLKLVAEGNSFTEISRKLDINSRSVERIKARVEQKLNAHSLSDLVREAIRMGLVQA